MCGKRKVLGSPTNKLPNSWGPKLGIGFSLICSKITSTPDSDTRVVDLYAVLFQALYLWFEKIQVPVIHLFSIGSVIVIKFSLPNH
jgi:hypothetical protein